MLSEIIAVHTENNIKPKEQCGATLIIFNLQARGSLETAVHGRFH
jgi:hypothetical protein